MNAISTFLKRKNVVFSAKRYFIDAMSAMAQGLFCTLLVGTILNTLGTQFHIGFLNAVLVTIGKGDGALHYTMGGLASAMVGPGMAVAIGRALEAPPLVLFSLIPVGFATNAMGGAGGPLAVFFVTIVATELGKIVSKETKVDILVTPIVTILFGVGFAYLVAAPIGTAASAVGKAIMEARCFSSLTVLIQKEVAQRICAAPGTADYGAFTLLMQYYTAPELLFTVPPTCFMPAPKVTSAVIHCPVRSQPPVSVNSEDMLWRTVRGGFALRRKTLVNSLATAYGSQLSKEELTDCLSACNLPSDIRGERLSLEDYAHLANTLQRMLAEKEA